MTGILPSSADSDRDPTPAEDILEFLNDIEGSGYGGMATFEIARQHAREMVRVEAPDSSEDLSVWCLKHPKEAAGELRRLRAVAQCSPQPVCDLCDAPLMCAACGHEQRPAHAKAAPDSGEVLARGAPDDETYDDARLARQLMDTYNVSGDKVFWMASKRLTALSGGIRAAAYTGPTPQQIEPILDDFLGVDSPHYEELRRRCAQRIFEVCLVMSGVHITPSDNRISSLPSTQNSPPVELAPQNSAERMPSSDAASAGGETVPSTPRGGEA